MSSILEHLSGDELDLNKDILGETGDLDTRAGGLGLAKEGRVDLVEGDKVVHVLEEAGGLEDRGLGGARGGEHTLNVLDDTGLVMLA